MAIIKIDDQEYDSDQLTPKAKGLLQMLMASEAKIKDTERDLAMFRAARVTYGRELKAALAANSAAPTANDEILKFS